MYLYEMGNAMAYVAGADMLPREMASNIRILPVSSKCYFFHCGWYSLQQWDDRTQKNDYKPFYEATDTDEMPTQVEFQRVAGLRVMWLLTLALFRTGDPASLVAQKNQL